MPRQIRVSPNEKRPTHHVSLTDGEKTVGLIMCTSDMSANPLAIARAAVPRTAMKTTTGNQKYSDFEPPWTPIAQDSWGGGRGQMDFEKDVTRYFDGLFANTANEVIFNGGLPSYTNGLRTAIRHHPGSVHWLSLVDGGNNYIAARFDSPADFTAASMRVLVKRKGTPTGSLTVKLCDNNAGYPGMVKWTGTIDTSTVSDYPSTWMNFAPAVALSNSLTYWLVFQAGGDQDNHWQLGYEDNGLDAGSLEGSDGTSWYTSIFDPYYILEDANNNEPGLLFQYKNQQYLIINDPAGGAPHLWQNGDRGVASSATPNTLVDSGKTWTADEWKGALVWITGGKGFNSRVPYRIITGNDATSVTFDAGTPWEITPDTTTEYVIVEADHWLEVTGHGLTKPVGNVMVASGVLYFSQGDATNIRRARWTSAGWAWADDGTNKASFMCLVQESKGAKIWKANNSDASSKVSVANASIVAWGTNLTFGTAIPFEDDKGTINGLEEYGDTYRYLWVFRDAGVFSIELDSTGSTYAAIEMPLREMAALRSDTNGIAHLVHNVYMYFSLGPGVERYFQRALDDVGPNRDEGFPPERQGYPSAMAGYPGKYFIAYNAAGTNGYSSVVAYNGVGYNEVYRCPKPGLAIDAMQFQSLPWSGMSRLWIHVGDDMIWLPFSPSSPNPTKDPTYPFIWESYVVSSWISAGMVDIYKLLHSVKVFADNVGEDSWVEVDYQLDQDGSWHTLPDGFAEVPVSEVEFSSHGETAKRFRYRVRLLTADRFVSPIVRTVVVEAISRVPIKYSYSFPFRVKDEDTDLEGTRDGMTVQEKINTLDEWAAKLTALTMRCIHEEYDGQVVFIDPASHTPGREHSEGYVGKLTVIEV